MRTHLDESFGEERVLAQPEKLFCSLGALDVRRFKVRIEQGEAHPVHFEPHDRRAFDPARSHFVLQRLYVDLVTVDVFDPGEQFALAKEQNRDGCVFI